MQLDFDYRPGEDLPYATLARLREAGPVVWSDAVSGWLVTSYAAVREVLSDVSRFTSAGTPVAEVFGAEGMLVNDTPMHHTLRAVWAKAVSLAAMKARIAEMEGNAARLIGEAAPRLAAGEAVNLVPLFRNYVMEFIASSFAVSRDKLDVFERWSQQSADTPAIAMEEGSEAQLRHNKAKADVVALVAEEMLEREARMARGEEPGDLVSLMVAARGHGGITPDMAADNLFNFILGAMDTTEKWLGNVVLRLCSDAELRARVAADRSLIERLADETMRCDTVAQAIQRRVREPGAVLCGRQLKGGDALFLMLGAANRDGAEFADPDRFDVARTVKPNLGFGFGFHHCLGINIARCEVAAFIGVLLDSLPGLQVAEADMGASWALWGPRRLEVALA